MLLEGPSDGAFVIVRSALLRIMGLLWSLLIGGVAGWLAGRIMKSAGNGVFVNILLGLIGGLVGGWVFGILGLAAFGLIGRLIVATVGAVILIALARAIRK